MAAAWGSTGGTVSVIAEMLWTALMAEAKTSCPQPYKKDERKISSERTGVHGLRGVTSPSPPLGLHSQKARSGCLSVPGTTCQGARPFRTRDALGPPVAKGPRCAGV